MHKFKLCACEHQIWFQVVGALGTETNRPSSAAQCVAYIAVTELPQGQWPDLISTLVSNVVQPQSTAIQKEATLEAIGEFWNFYKILTSQA